MAFLITSVKNLVMIFCCRISLPIFFYRERIHYCNKTLTSNCKRVWIKM